MSSRRHTHEICQMHSLTLLQAPADLHEHISARVVRRGAADHFLLPNLSTYPFPSTFLAPPFSSPCPFPAEQYSCDHQSHHLHARTCAFSAATVACSPSPPASLAASKHASASLGFCTARARRQHHFRHALTNHLSNTFLHLHHLTKLPSTLRLRSVTAGACHMRGIPRAPSCLPRTARLPLCPQRQLSPPPKLSPRPCLAAPRLHPHTSQAPQLPSTLNLATPLLHRRASAHRISSRRRRQLRTLLGRATTPILSLH